MPRISGCSKICASRSSVSRTAWPKQSLSVLPPGGNNRTADRFQRRRHGIFVDEPIQNGIQLRPGRNMPLLRSLKSFAPRFLQRCRTSGAGRWFSERGIHAASTHDVSSRSNCSTACAIRKVKRRERRAPAHSRCGLRRGWKELLHQPAFVGLEGFELGALGGGQVVERGEAGGHFSLFVFVRWKRKRYFSDESLAQVFLSASVARCSKLLVSPGQVQEHEIRIDGRHSGCGHRCSAIIH